MKSLFDGDIGLVSRVLDMQLQRQNVVSSNLANLKTPGYRARSVSFEDELQAALGLDAKGITLLSLTLLVSSMSLSTGRTTVLQGAVHLVIFAVYLFTTIVP